VSPEFTSPISLLATEESNDDVELFCYPMTSTSSNLQENCYTAFVFLETFNMINNHSLYLIMYGEIANIVITQAENHNRALISESSWEIY